MKKIIAVLSMITTLFAFNAEASIHRTVDSSQNAVIYHTSKKIDYFNSLAILEITKTSRMEGNDDFVLQINYSGWGVNKHRVLDVAQVIVDDVEYNINKIIIPQIVVKPRKNLVQANFLVPKDVEEHIKNYKQYCWFRFSRDGKKPTLIKLNPKEQEEVRLIAKLRYEDFNALVSGELKPNVPNKK